MFWRTKQEESPAPEQPAQHQSIYSTDGENLSGKRELDRHRAIAAHMRQPHATGAAMDSATGLVPDFKRDLAGNQGVPDAQFFWYMGQSFIGYQVAAIMSQHWLVDKACLMPARDAVRTGYEVSLPEETVNAERIIELLKKADKRHGITKTMREYIHMGRVYGVRVAIFRVESTDPDYYKKPFNPDGVVPGSYRGISQVDPIWITPELTDAAVSDPANIRFYDPEFYVIGGRRYHRSHLCVYVPYPVPDSIKPQYMYAGKSVPQMIYERVYAAERTANEAPQLAMTKRLVVHKTDGAGFFSDLTKSLARMFDFTSVRDNYGVMVIDKEADEIQQHDTTLSELDAVIMNQYQLVASIAEVPATKLLGTTPKGFNATGEAEAQDYRIMLESIQTNDLQPLLERHHQMIWLSDIKQKVGGDDVDMEISWKPLDSPTAAEWAAINLQKAQAAQILAAVGAIDGQDIRQQLRQDKESDFFGLEEVDFDDEPELSDGPEDQA